MSEELLSEGRPWVDINFENDPVGSTMIYDRGDYGLSFTRKGSSTTGSGVVDHPTLGKCFRFNRNIWFLANKKLNIYNKKFRIDFKAIFEDTYCKAFSTGNVPLSQVTANQSYQPGMTLNIKQPNFAFFHYYSTTDVIRLELDPAWPGLVPVHLRAESTDGINTTFTNLTSGASVTKDMKLTAESDFYIGNRSVGDYAFHGWLKSMTIELLE